MPCYTPYREINGRVIPRKMIQKRSGTHTMADEIYYEVVEKLGVLSESPTGWTKELRVVKWNDRNPRYDLREWSPGEKVVSRGITMSPKEMRTLVDLLLELGIPETFGQGTPTGAETEAGLDASAEVVESSEAKAEGGSKRKAS